MKKIQLQYSYIEMFKISQKQLYVKVSEEKLYQCFGKIHGEQPIFILKESGLQKN